MKKLLFLASALIVPPMLFVAAQLAPPQVAPSPTTSPKATPSGLLWKPKLVGTDPDGSAYLTWDSDGQSVQVAPMDRRQNLQWGDCSLPASKGSSVPELTSSQPPVWKINFGEAYDDSDPKKPSLVVSAPGSKISVSLQNTPWKLFGIDYDNIEGNWHFQDSGFSPDWSQVFIITSGCTYIWSTSTGKLLRRVSYDDDQNPDYGAKFSPDCRWLLSPLGVGVFETRTGRKHFSLPDFGSGAWSPDDQLFWIGTDRGVEFFRAQTGRRLWHTKSEKTELVRFASQGNTVILSCPQGFELRDEFTGKVQRTLHNPTDNLEHFAVSPDGLQLWASYANGQIWSWRLR